MLHIKCVCVCCRDNPIGSRMVHFMGHDLLMLAPKNDEYVGGHILKTGQQQAACSQPGPSLNLLRALDGVEWLYPGIPSLKLGSPVFLSSRTVCLDSCMMIVLGKF